MKIKKVLVSQPKPASEKSPFFTLAEKYNLELDFRPFIRVEGLGVKDFRSQRIDILQHTAIIFTARTAIDHFFSLCEEMRISVPEDMKYFCISEMVALYLQKYIQYRKRKIFFSKTRQFDGLIPALKKHTKEKFLLAVANISHTEDRNTLLLNEHNIAFHKAAFYKTVSNDFTSDEKFDYDMLLFFSPDGINSLLKNFPEYKQENTVIATFGVKTALAVTDAGLRLDIGAPNKNFPSITGAIDAFLKENKTTKK